MFWEVIGLVILFGAIAEFDVPRLVGRHWWPELWAFSIFLGLGMIGTILVVLKVF